MAEAEWPVGRGGRISGVLGGSGGEGERYYGYGVSIVKGTLVVWWYGKCM